MFRRHHKRQWCRPLGRRCRGRRPIGRGAARRGVVATLSRLSPGRVRRIPGIRRTHYMWTLWSGRVMLDASFYTDAMLITALVSTDSRLGHVILWILRYKRYRLSFAALYIYIYIYIYIYSFVICRLYGIHVIDVVICLSYAVFYIVFTWQTSSKY